MAIDLMTRLLLNTSNFDANLNRSKKNVNEYQKGILGMSSAVAGGIMKFAGAIGIAVTASEGLSKIIHSSQTLGDEYARTMDGIKNCVDQFFYSIGSGDWTPFMNGLTDTIRLAAQASDAIDKLGNAKISFSYFDSKNQANLQKQVAILKDKESSESQKEAARKELDDLLTDQENMVAEYNKRSKIAVRAMVKAAIGIDGVDVSDMDIEKILKFDISAKGDEEKAKLASQFKDFVNEYDTLKAKFTKYETVGSGMNVHVVAQTDNNKLGAALKPLLKEYQEAIEYNAILVKKQDAWLKDLTATKMAAFQAEQSLESMRKTANRASQAGLTKGDGNKKYSLGWYNDQIAVQNKKLIGETDKQAREAIQATINELEKKKIKLQVEEAAGSLESINVQLAGLNKKYLTATTDEARKQISELISELEAKKIHINLTVKYDEKKAGNLDLPSMLPSDGVPTHGKDGMNFKLPDVKKKPLFDKKDIKANQEYEKSLYDISSVMSNMSGLFDSNTASALQWGASLLSTMSQAIPKIIEMAAANDVESASAKRNAIAQTVDASGKVINAHAGIPFVGIALGLAGVAAIIAAMASMPEFATGGIVPGTSFTGDKVPAYLNSGEMILNGTQQGRLFQIINAGSAGALSKKIAPDLNGGWKNTEVKFIIHGRDLEGVLTNHNNQKGKVR